MPDFSTRYKIAIGYILLTIMLITTMGYMYRSMKAISGRTELSLSLSVRRAFVNEIMNDLNEAEIIVQAIAIGKTEEYKNYTEVMSLVYDKIDSLKSITTDAANCEALDDILMFMKV